MSFYEDYKEVKGVCMVHCRPRPTPWKVLVVFTKYYARSVRSRHGQQ